jgi:uncharacterized membrane protein
VIFLENFKKYGLIFTVGAVGYSAIEILWRGFTHPSMAVAGGICFVLIAEIERRFYNIPYLYKCILGSLSVTIVEFVFGAIFNIMLKQNVWDYSGIKFNFLGQICLLYSVLWGFLTALTLPLSRKLFSALQK